MMEFSVQQTTTIFDAPLPAGGKLPLNFTVPGDAASCWVEAQVFHGDGEVSHRLRYLPKRLERGPREIAATLDFPELCGGARAFVQMTVIHKSEIKNVGE
jgi:hypothetical protein